MFALLAPAGFAVVVGVKKRLDAHRAWKEAQKRKEAQSAFRGAAAGALPDEELDILRQRAAVATERIAGLENLIQEMTARLQGEEKEREYLEKEGRAKVTELEHLRKKNDILARDVCQKAAEAEALLQRAERNRAFAAKSAASADAAGKALVVVSEAMLRWREELVLCSLDRATLGQAPSARKIMEVVSDIDNEITVTVMNAEMLPDECRKKLEEKRAELKLHKRGDSVQSTTDWEYQPRSALSQPDRLARLLASTSASTSAPAAHGPVDFPRVETPTKYRTKVTAAAAAAAAAPAGGKENSQAKGPGAGPREVQLPAGLRDISPNALTQAARSAAAAAAAGAAGESWAACARSGSGDELEVARGAGAGSASAQRSNGRTHQGSAASAAAVRGDGVEAYLLPAGDRSFARYKSLKVYAKSMEQSDGRNSPDLFSLDTVPLSELSHSSSKALALLKGN